MKKQRRLTFRFSELLLLVFEINLGFACMAMIAATFSGQFGQLYAPARSLMSMLPAMLCVGFASWFLYRVRCIRQADSQVAGLLGAVCLALVALSFGAAVGKLSMVCMTDGFQEAVEYAISNPLQKLAGRMSLLAFIGIGLVFGATFVLQAGRRDHANSVSNDSLHFQIGNIGQRVIQNWSEQLVTRIDALVQCGDHAAAVRMYEQETGSNKEDATRVIDDWPEQRLRLQLEVLVTHLQRVAERTESVASTVA